MPHRPIGSRWRFIATVGTPNIRIGDTATVVGHQGPDNRIVLERTGNEFVRSLLDGVWLLIEDAPQANPLAPPPVAPQGAPIPAREQFTPRPDEQYIAVYRRTPEAARASVGAAHMGEEQSRFWVVRQAVVGTSGTLEEARRNVRAVIGTHRDYDVYIIPLRAIEHWYAGVAQPLGLDINEPQPQQAFGLQRLVDNHEDDVEEDDF